EGGATGGSAGTGTGVRVTACSRGSCASRSSRRASSAWIRWATRSRRCSATGFSVSVVQELHPLLAEFGELQAVDELDHLAQAGVDVRLIGAHLAHAQDGPLPMIVLLALGDRHVEGVLDPRLDGAEHAALALQRMVLGQQQLGT